MRRALVQAGPFLGWSAAWLLIAGLLVAVLGGRLTAAPGDAPAFKTYEAELGVDLKDRKKVNDLLKLRSQFANGSAQLGGNETAFEDLYTKFLFPSWTLTDEDHLGALAKERDKFLTIDLGKSPQPVHDRLTQLTLTQMTRFAQDSGLHPGVRYNAVLILGALNSREADRINKANPEPLPAALAPLKELFTKKDETDAVRVAALLGLLRHLEWDDFRKQTQRMAPEDKATIVKELIALAKESAPPAGRSPEGHTWMRRRAVEGLMYASQTETTREIADIIEKLIASNADPIALRCTAADIMGRLDYKDPVKPAPDPNARELGYLALVACNAELNRLEDDEKKGRRAPPPGQFGPGTGGGMGVPGGMGGGMMGGGPGGMGGMMGGMIPGGKPAGAPDSKGMGGMMGGMMGGKPKGKQPKAKKEKATSDLLAPNAGAPKGGAAKSSDLDSQRLDALRRRLRAWLYAVQIGLGDEKANPANKVERIVGAKGITTQPRYNRGVAAYAAEEKQKAYVQDVIAKVQNVAKVVEAPDLDQEEFLDDLRKEMASLENITKPLKAESPQPAANVPGVPAKAAATAPAGKAAAVAAEDVPVAPPAAAAATENAPTGAAAAADAASGAATTAPATTKSP